MRIALLTHPGRGDTEPFIALALRLRQGGHTVKLTSRPDLADVVAEYGLDFFPIGNPYQPFIAGAADAGAMGSGHPLAKLRFGIKNRTYVSKNLNHDALGAVRRNRRHRLQVAMDLRPHDRREARDSLHPRDAHAACPHG